MLDALLRKSPMLVHFWSNAFDAWLAAMNVAGSEAATLELVCPSLMDLDLDLANSD